MIFFDILKLGDFKSFNSSCTWIHKIWPNSESLIPISMYFELITSEFKLIFGPKYIYNYMLGL